MWDINLVWLQDNLLTIAIIILTAVLIYYFVIENDSGTKLSKHYRNSIFETQSKIFLNATQYLISGNKELAIKEFLSAMDLSRETVDLYFALGGLFRSNGEIDKAVNIHKSLVAKENIGEATRLLALKELATDFDKGGMIDKAIETYRELLMIDPEQMDALKSLCRIYEDIEDWELAYTYRQKLSKITKESQSAALAQIRVQQARLHFDSGNYRQCAEELDEAFRHGPSVSGKLLRLKLKLLYGQMEDAKSLFFEMLKEHGNFVNLVVSSIQFLPKGDPLLVETYKTGMGLLFKDFLEWDDSSLLGFEGINLTKAQLFVKEENYLKALTVLENYAAKAKSLSDQMEFQLLSLRLKLMQTDKLIPQLTSLLPRLVSNSKVHFCQECGFKSDYIFWRCPQCKDWETIKPT